MSVTGKRHDLRLPSLLRLALGMLLVLSTIGSRPHRTSGQPARRSLAILEIPEDDGPPDPVKTHGAQYVANVAGVPSETTASLDSATTHAVILATSGIGGGTFTDEQREKVRTYVRRGGVFIAGNFKDSNLFEVFGIGGEDFDRGRHRMTFLDERLGNAFDWIDDPRERTISLGDTTRNQVIFSRSYAPRDAAVLARFDDGSAAITKNQYGEGHAYLLGVSLRDVTIRNQMNMDFTAQRSFPNDFEPTTDAFSLFVRSIYREHVPHAVRKHTSPLDTRSTVMITHDVDSESGMVWMNRYADYEQSQGITATYYVTTRYVDDNLGKDYYPPYRDSVRHLHQQGQRIGSHSVGHFPDFDDLPLGTAGNTRDTYTPRYNGDRTVDGTVMGELEVSKTLLEQDVPQDVSSFRAGHLLYPDKLVNGLDTLGYRFNSTFSANTVLASFPYRNLMGRSFSGAISDVWEVPMTISDVFDEKPISAENYPEKVDVWIDVFRRYSANGAPVVLLIHPNRGYKLDAEQAFVERLPSDVAILPLESFGRFWANRAAVDVETRHSEGQLTIQIENRTTLPDSLSLVVDDGTELDEITLLNEEGNALSYKTDVRLDGSLLLYSPSPAGNELVAEASVAVNSSGRMDFGETGLDVHFAGVQGSGVVSAQKFRTPPNGTEGIEETNVSDYRFVLDAGNGLRVDSAVVYLETGALSGLGNPDSVTVYRRSLNESDAFSPLPTQVDDNDTPRDRSDDRIYAGTSRLGEFVLASNTEPLPVELVEFDATRIDERVRLTWRTASETNNAGFRVQRRAEDGSWVDLEFVGGQGTTTSPSTYRFTDEDLPFAEDSLAYRLEQVDTDGSTSLSDAVVLSRGTPETVQLQAPLPNPVRTRATIRYAVPRRQDITLSLYDVLGRRVKVVKQGSAEAGRKRRTLDVSGLSSGVYFLRLRGDEAIQTQKLTVVR